jgi:hypothetical protein
MIVNITLVSCLHEEGWEMDKIYIHPSPKAWIKLDLSIPYCEGQVITTPSNVKLQINSGRKEVDLKDVFVTQLSTRCPLEQYALGEGTIADTTFLDSSSTSVVANKIGMSLYQNDGKLRIDTAASSVASYTFIAGAAPAVSSMAKIVVVTVQTAYKLPDAGTGLHFQIGCFEESTIKLALLSAITEPNARKSTIEGVSFELHLNVKNEFIEIDLTKVI